MGFHCCPDGTYRIDTPGYEHVPFQKIYAHPRKRHPLLLAVCDAKKKGLILPSLDEIVALRCAVGTQFAAEQPQLTRTLLWQWNGRDGTQLGFEDQCTPDSHTLFTHARRFAQQDCALLWDERQGYEYVRTKMQEGGFRTLRQEYSHKEIPLDALATDPFVRLALRTALRPYARHLSTYGYAALTVILPPRPAKSDRRIAAYPLTLDFLVPRSRRSEPTFSTRLFSPDPVGFCQGVRPKEYNHARTHPQR